MKYLLTLALVACSTITAMAQNVGDVRMSIWDGSAPWNSGIWTGSNVVPFLDGTAIPAVRSVSGTGSILASGGTGSSIMLHSPTITGVINNGDGPVIDADAKTLFPGWEIYSPKISGTMVNSGTISGGTVDAGTLKINGSTINFATQTASISSGTSTIDLASGNFVSLAVTGTSTVLVFTNPVQGMPYFIQINSGTFINPTVTFPAGSTQSLSGTNVYTASGTGTAVVDVVPFIFTTGTTVRILDASVYYTP